MKLRADRRVGLLLGGVMLSTFVAIGATVVLPAMDPSLDVEDVKLSGKDIQKGMEIVRREGLWRCDPFARETLVDGAGAVTPEDIAGLNPVMLNTEYVGRSGDLCGVKLSDDDTRAVLAFLTTRTP